MLGSWLTVGMLVGQVAAAEPELPVAGAAEPEAPPTVAVVLDDAGHGARRALAYTFEDGDGWQVQVRKTGALVTSSPGVPDTRADTRPATYTLDLLVKGGALVATLIDTSLDGATIEELATLQAELADLSIVHRRLPSDPHARTLPAWDGPTDLLSELGAGLVSDAVWAVEALTVPLPDAPVGVGARWSWAREAEEGGVRLTEQVQAELVQFKRGVAVVQLRSTGGSDATLVDGMPISGVRLTSTATVWIDPARPPVTAAKLDLTATLWLPATESMPDQTATATTHLDVATRDRPSVRVDRHARGG